MTLGPMRTGRTLGRTLYLATGNDWEAHQCIGMVDTPEQAQAIVAAVNLLSDPERAVEAIWDRWERDLPSWDLEGSAANRRAHALAVEALRDLLPGNAKSPAGHPEG